MTEGVSDDDARHFGRLLLAILFMMGAALLETKMFSL